MVDAIESMTFELLISVLDVSLILNILLLPEFVDTVSLELTIFRTYDDLVLQNDVWLAIVIKNNIISIVSDVIRSILDIVIHVPDTEKMVFFAVLYINDYFLSANIDLTTNDYFFYALTLF